ncbi:MAG: DUF488 domain-containing protein [Henriciella sp.]|nr:DUF488 domain-containing protein [Henriciella sp.]
MIYTIGYEGSELDNFLRTLDGVGVSVLIDVRDRAQSRKKGFSKSALSQALEEVGIKYLHFPKLGDPKEGRQAARSGDIALFRKIYSNVLSTREAQVEINKIKEIAKEKKVCLMCFERNPKECHRKMITDEIDSSTSIGIRHIGVQKYEQAA